MRTVTTLVVAASFVVVAFTENFNYENYKVYRLQPTQKQQLQFLSELRNNSQIDFWSLPKQVGEFVDVMVDPYFQYNVIKFFERTGIKYNIFIDNVERIIQQERTHQSIAPETQLGKITFTKYHRHNEINAYLDELAQKYSNIVTVESIGKSYEGRDIKIIRISTKSSVKKPIIYIDAAIHAREWITPPVPLYIIKQLVESSSNGAMLEKVDWHILPVVNPDGYEYSHTKSRLWRKTRSPNTRCYGTDGNRNFDFHWGETGASDDECQETYRGSKPFSEVETQTVRDDILKYKDQIKLYLTFHSHGQYLLYPWGYTADLPEDAEELQTLGQLVADAIREFAGTKYTVGSSTNVLYAAAGGSDDWVKGVSGVNLSYTIELPSGGSSGFDPPPNNILPVVAETWEGIKAYHRYIQEKFG